MHRHMHGNFWMGFNTYKSESIAAILDSEDCSVDKLLDDDDCL